MRLLILLLATAITLVGCRSSGELRPLSQIPPGVAAEGSLANAKLLVDTTAAIRQIEQTPEADVELDIARFVIQQPVGQPGSLSWREMWIVEPDGNSRQYVITFREDGFGGARFDIQSSP